MCSTDQLEVVPVHEVGGDLSAKQPARATGADRPSVHVLGVGPDEIAERS